MKVNEKQLIDLIVRRIAGDDSVDPPQQVSQYVKNLFRGRITESRSTLAGRVLAVLRVDIAAGLSPAGERAVGSAVPRQLLFDAGDIAIDMRIKHQKYGSTIRGQVLGEGFGGGKVVMIGPDDSLVKTARIGALGEFSFKGVSTGKYAFQVRRHDKQIELPPLAIP